MRPSPARTPRRGKKIEAAAAEGGATPGPDGAPKRETKSAKLSRANEDRYRAIVDTAVDAIIVADHLGSIRGFNRAAEKIFGYTAEEAVGRNVKFLCRRPTKLGTTVVSPRTARPASAIS